MDKYAAEKIAQEYYNMGVEAFTKTALVDPGAIQDAIDIQRQLYTGDAEDRIGSSIEQRRREGAIGGTTTGGIIGLLGGAGVGLNRGGKALGALGALLGAGAGAVTGNLVGRGAGLLGGSIEGGLSALPGVRGAADFLAKPLDEY